MARYIDADKVREGVEALQISLESNNDAIWEKNKPYYKGLAMARAVINETPTADVVPRAEVAKEIFGEIEKKSCTISETNTAAGHTRVICYQISSETLEELKKKYAEGQK